MEGVLMPSKSAKIHPASPKAAAHKPLNDQATLNGKLNSIEEKLKSHIPEELSKEVDEAWYILKEYLGKSTSASLSKSLSILTDSPNSSAKKHREYFANYAAPLFEMAKLPIKVRLELAELMDKLLEDLSKHTKVNIFGMTNQVQAIKKLIDNFSSDLVKFADKHKKITVIGAISTTFASFTGLIIGAVLAPFSIPALMIIAAHYVKKTQNNTAKAIGAGIAGLVAGIVMAPLFPLLIASLPIIKNTNLFNLQIDKITSSLSGFQELFTDSVANSMTSGHSSRENKVSHQEKLKPKTRSNNR
jgi:hypothetical protein